MKTEDARTYIRDLIAMKIVREIEADKWPRLQPLVMQEVMGVVRTASLRVYASITTDICLVSRGLAQWFNSEYIDVFFDAYIVRHLYLAVLPSAVAVAGMGGGGTILVVVCEDLDTFTKKRFLLAPCVPQLYKLPVQPEEEDDEQ